MKLVFWFDVIIPTFNNAGVLPYTLDALFAQDVPDGWGVHIIISDDGSTDDTVSVANRWCLGCKRCRVVQGAHTGAAGARNRGLKEAKGDVVFFLGADNILRPGAIAAHINFHSKYPEPEVGALGFVRWDPRCEPTPLMEWMMHGGPQNDYDSLLGVKSVSPAHGFYAANISFKASMVGEDLFSEEFEAYGWEDLEAGCRLARAGVVLRVLEAARALHWHHYSVADIVYRQYQVGRGLVKYQQLHPETSLLPKDSLWRYARHLLVSYSGLEWMARLFTEKGGASQMLFMWITTLPFWRGVRQVRGNINKQHKVIHKK